MKRFIKLFMILLVAFALVAPAQAAWKDMWAQVYKMEKPNFGQTTLTEITSGVTFIVLQRNSDTIETLYVYKDDTFTSLTNPVTTTNFESATVCNDRVAFRVDPGESGDTYVDLIVVDTDGGFTAFVEDFDEYTHKIVIDQTPNVMHSGCIWFTDDSTGEIDSGIDFDYDIQIKSAWVEVISTVTSGTIDVGLLSSETNGDADGLLDGVSLGTSGHVLPTLTTSGALMDDGTNFDPNGHVVASANAKSLTVTTNSDTGSTVRGFVHYLFTRIR